MPEFKINDGAYWFYWSLVVTGAVVCITYRHDSVSFSAGVAAVVIGGVMLLLPPLIRGGWLLWRVMAMTGTLISLVILIAFAHKGGANPTERLALTALLLLLAYIVSDPTLRDRWKKQRAISRATVNSTKGYLDHQADLDKSRETATRTLNEISKIKKEETEAIKARTEKIPRIMKMSPAKQLAAARKAASHSDKITQRLAAKIQILSESLQVKSSAEVAYWEWRTTKSTVSQTEATTFSDLLKKSLLSNQEFLEAIARGREALSNRLGMSQFENEAIERRLVVENQLYEAVSSEQQPLQRVISLLEPFTKNSQQENIPYRDTEAATSSPFRDPVGS